MALPKKAQDEHDEERNLSALERAQRSWGMSPGTEGQAAEDEERSALDKARDRWGEADVIDGQDVGEANGPEAAADTSDANDSPTDGTSDHQTQPDDLYKGRGKKIKWRGRFNRRNGIVASIIIIPITTALIGAVFYLPNLMMKYITNTIQDATMGFVDRAIEQRTEKYIQHYVAKVITPTVNRCGTTLNRSCGAVSIADEGILGATLRNWQDNRIEQKLFDRHGVFFERGPNSNEIIVRRANGFGVTGEVGRWGENTVTREVRRLFGDVLETEGVLERWQVRSLLARKYGANKWCVIACNTRDELTTARIGALNKLKLRIIQRVVTPRNERAAAYLMCFTFGCDNPANVADNAARTALEAVDADIAERVAGRTMSQFLADEATQAIVRPFFGRETAVLSGRIASASVPVVGWVYLAASLGRMFSNIDQAIANREISQYAAKMNEEAYAHNLATFVTLSDDIQSGEASFEDMGASVQLMAGFQRSRVYQSATGVQNLSNVACEDGVVLQGNDDPLACPEKQVHPEFFLEEARNSPAGQAISMILTPYDQCILPLGFTCISPATVINRVLDGINWVLGGIGNAALSGIGRIPGIGSLMEATQEWLSEIIGDIAGWVMTRLFPSVINPDASSDQQYDQWFAGQDVVANAYAQGHETEDGDRIGLGAPYLNAEEAASLQYTINQERQEEWESMSTFARVFNISDYRSVSSRMTVSFATTFATLLDNPFSLNPFASIAGGLSGIMTPRTQAAVIANREAVFGVKQYGFPVNDRAMTIDPAELTPEACETFKQEREDTSYIDEKTKEKVYTVSDPCMLDNTVTAILTKVFNLDAGGTSPSSGRVDCSNVSGNAKIICAAQGYQDVRYANYWSDTDWEGIWGVSRIEGSIGQNPEQWVRERIVGGANDFLECSGYVKVAIYTAFGVVSSAQSSQGYIDDTANFRVLVSESDYGAGNYSSLQPGDILVRRDRGSGSGHIGIFVSNSGNGRFSTLETSGSNNVKGERKSGYFEVSPGAYDYALRYVGAGSSAQ